MTLARTVMLVALLASASCGPSTSNCALSQDCDSCVSDGCAWCFETGACLGVTATCPGDRATTAEQCESEAAADDDAGAAGAR